MFVVNVISKFLWLEIAILLQDVQMHPEHYTRVHNSLQNHNWI
jgi:uncharacterized protein with PQ loop repeat